MSNDKKTYKIRVSMKCRDGSIASADLEVDAKNEAMAKREMQDKYPLSKIESLGEMVEVQDEPMLSGIFRRALAS
jgi:hypothetical protein